MADTADPSLTNRVAKMTSEAAASWSRPEPAETPPVVNKVEVESQDRYGTLYQDLPAVQTSTNPEALAEKRTATVNRGTDGRVLGVAIMLNEAELLSLGLDLEDVQQVIYHVADGRLWIQQASEDYKGGDISE